MCKYVLQLLGLELVAGSVCAMSEELGLSETETDRVLTQVLGPCPDDYEATWQP